MNIYSYWGHLKSCCQPFQSKEDLSMDHLITVSNGSHQNYTIYFYGCQQIKAFLNQIRTLTKAVMTLTNKQSWESFCVQAMSPNLLRCLSGLCWSQKRRWLTDSIELPKIQCTFFCVPPQTSQTTVSKPVIEPAKGSWDFSLSHYILFKGKSHPPF